MELKAFKGMPHEFGGIDYTEDSEVEGGEFAVEIGKSGNEYIFDKNSSEGERLSKEYKKLDKNGRLTEDDPLALETFDQIAREEALKHAQRSVNEKGIDPFRNMYEQGGQAANGGVKYKDKYFWKGGAMPKNKPIYGYYADGGGKSYTDKIKDAERDFNESLDYPMDKAYDAFQDEFANNPRLAGDDMYLDPYRHGMAGYYTADAMKKKMPSWMPESVANKLAIAGSTIAGIGHEFASPSTDRMGLVDGLTEAGQDAYNNYVGAKMIEDVLFDREAKQLMLDKIKREETYPGVVVSDTDPYNLPKNAKEALDRGFTFDQMINLEKRGLIDLNDGTLKFQNGGGKKKDEAGDYGTVTNEATCVKGVNCFEDLARVQGIPDSIYNNRAMREFLQSEEGKKLFEKVDNPQPGDLVQFNKANPKAAFKNLIEFYTKGNSNPSDLKYFEYLFNYPFHTGVIKDDKNYIGDGSSYEPVHSGIFDFSNFFSPSNDYYRYKDPESAKKVLEAAKYMEQNKTDIFRKTFGEEKPTKYRNPEEYSSMYSYPIAGF